MAFVCWSLQPAYPAHRRSPSPYPDPGLAQDISSESSVVSHDTMSEPHRRRENMQVTILGSGSPIPDANRAGPATLVRAGGQMLLFDCGRGVLMRAVAAGAAPAGLNSVFLTHLHSDHVSDFNDVVTTRWVTTFEPSPLPVVGPRGTRAFAEATLAMLEADIGYRLAHHDDLTWRPGIDVTEVAGGVAYDVADVRVLAAPTDHRPVEPTVGYRIEAEGSAVV